MNLAKFRITFALHGWLLFAIGLTLAQQPQAFADEPNPPEFELVEPTSSSNNAEITDYSEIIENADIQSTDDNAIYDKIDRELNSTVNNVIDNIFGDLFGGLNDFLGGLENTVGDFVNSKIPDIGKIIDIIFNREVGEGETDLPSKQQSETLEGNPDGYAISESETDAVVREVLVETVSSATFDRQAQTNLKQTAVRVQKSVSESVDLGQDSQSRDVTQQILQNLSQQEAISATRQGIIVQQNQQAQVDRAISNMLNAQQAEELAGINAAKRREDIGTANLTVRQWGLIRLPGNPSE
ncbi:MAG: hypothetical protein AAFR62_04430 [Cyanobacteria bacterium J06629_2]